MQWLNHFRMRLVVVGFTAGIVLCGGGSANADFTFGEPTNLGPTVNSGWLESAPSLSADSLTLLFVSDRPGGHGNEDIWVATRPTMNDAWSDPVNLGPTVNTGSYDRGVCIAPDGLALYIASNRPGGFGNLDLWVATRSTVHDLWTPPANLGPTVNSAGAEGGPGISSDGLSLLFPSSRAGGTGSRDLWIATRATTADSWDPPVNLGPNVNSAANDSGPDVSTDGLVLVFSSERPGGSGARDLWLAMRATTADDWGAPVNLGPRINGIAFNSAPNISADGRTLLFYSDRPGGAGGRDIWQAPIVPIVDFNGDGIVDAADMAIMVDHWGEDYSLCDIGPMPWGDGIVDVQDLIALAEHLFEEVNDPTLLAHWPLDEAQSVIAYDNAGDYDGTLVGGPLWQPDGGMVAGALQFDGIDDYVSTDPVLDPADGKFSVLVWIKGGIPGQAILSQANGVNWLYTDSAEGYLMTELTNSGRSSVGPMLSQADITEGNWHRIGLVWDGSYRHLYVDGAEVAKDTAPLSGLESAGGGLYFGVGSTLAPGTYFSGLIDEVRIYDRVVAP